MARKKKIQILIQTHTQIQIALKLSERKTKNGIKKNILALVRVDDNDVNSNTGRRLGQHSNVQRDADAIDGEDSPLQSKRSSRLTNKLFLPFDRLTVNACFSSFFFLNLFLNFIYTNLDNSLTQLTFRIRQNVRMFFFPHSGHSFLRHLVKCRILGFVQKCGWFDPIHMKIHFYYSN